MDLIFKFCLEFKSHGDCLQWSHQEHRLKGMKAIMLVKTHSMHRNMSDVLGRSLDSSFLCDSLELTFWLQMSSIAISFFSLKWLTNVIFISPAAFHYKIYFITFSTAGEIFHINISILSSSICYHLNLHFFFTSHICRPISYSTDGI